MPTPYFRDPSTRDALDQQQSEAEALNQQAAANAHAAERQARQQAANAKSQQREVLRTANIATEADLQAQNRPQYTDAAGVIKPQQSDEQWTAQQAAKATAAAQKAAFAAEGRPYAVNPIDKSITPLKSDAEMQAAKAARAEALRRKSVTDQINELKTEANDPAIKSSLLNTTAHKNATKELTKAKEAARNALLSKSMQQSKATTGGNDWIPFNERPAPEAAAAAEQAKRLADPAQDLNEQDLAALEADPATAPMAAKIKGLGGVLSKHEEAAKFHGERQAAIWDAEMRRDNPAKWEAMRREKVLTDPKAFEASQAEFAAKQADLTNKIGAVQQKRQQTAEELAAIEADNATRVTDGIPVTDLIHLQDAAGNPVPWSKELAAKHAALTQQHGAWEKNNTDQLETLDLEHSDLQKHAALLTEAAKVHTARQQNERTAGLEALAKKPGMEGYAHALASLDQEHAARAADINEMYPEDSPQKQAAMAALQGDIEAKAKNAELDGVARRQDAQLAARRIFTTLNQDTGDFPAQLRDGKNQDPSLTGLLLNHPLPAGVKPQDVAVELDSLRQESAFQKSDGKKSSLLLPNGSLSVHPSLITDTAGYEKAVADSGAPDDAKKAALDALPAMRQEAGKQVFDTLNRYDPAILRNWVAKQSAKDPAYAQKDHYEQALDYTQAGKADKGIVAIVQRTLDNVARGVALGMLDTGAQFWGTVGAVTGSETASNVARATSDYTALSAQVQDIAGMAPNTAYRILGQGARTVTNMAPALAMGELTGGASMAVMRAFPAVERFVAGTSEALKTAKSIEQWNKAAGAVMSDIRLAGSAAGAAAQTGGSMYGELYSQFRNQGMTHEAARQAALIPAAASGLVTAVLTMGFGASGAEAVLSAEGGALARTRWQNILKQGAKGALEEIPEETLDELFSQFTQTAAAHPGQPLKETAAQFLESLPELIGSIAIAGGAGGVLHDMAMDTAPSGAGAGAAAPNPANLPERVAAAEVAIDEFNAPDLDPATIARTQDAARAVLYIAQGSPLTDLPADSLAALDIVENPEKPGTFVNGRVEAAKDGTAKLVTYDNGQVGDPATGAVRPVRVRIDEKGNAIISQGTLDKIETLMPAVRQAIPLDENARTQQIDSNGSGTNQSGNPDNGQTAGGTSKPAVQGGVQAAAGKGADAARSGQAAAQPVGGGTTAVLPSKLDAPQKKRATELANALVDLGLPDGPAARVGEAVVARHGVVGESYTEQFVSPEFRAALKELGISGALSASKAKENPLVAAPDFNDRISRFGLSESDAGKPGSKTSAGKAEETPVQTGLGADNVGASPSSAPNDPFAPVAKKKASQSAASQEPAKASTPTAEADAPAGIDGDEYLAARQAALKATKPDKRKGALKALTALDVALSRYGKAFDAVKFGPVSGGGLVVTRKGKKATLEIDLGRWLQQHSGIDPKNIGTAARAELEEEFIHRAATNVFTDADMAGFFRSLPRALAERVYEGYHKADIENKTVPAKLPDAIGAEQATVLGHEFLRMLVQDSQFAGRVSEAVAADPSLGEKIIAFLRDLVKSLRKMIDAADVDTRVTIAEYEKRVSNEVARLQKLLPSTPAQMLKAKETPISQSEDKRKSVTAGAESTAARPDFKPAAGSTGTAFTDGNDAIEYEWAVVDAESLNISNRDDGTINPEYPQELQPRDRTSAGSEAQVADIAKNANLDRLSESSGVGDGAPFTGPDGVVESGNGRLMGLRRAYQRGMESVLDYRQKLIDTASRFGLTAEQVKATRNPVLVRVRRTNVDRTAFVLAANVSTIAPKREIEQAKIDAKQITPDIFDTFVPSDNGDIFTAANAQFIQSFVSAVVPPAERPAVIDARGNLSQAGLRRIRNALFVHAYGESKETLNALAGLTESLDEGSKNLAGALVAIAPRFAEQNSREASGALYPLSITGDLAWAVQQLADLGKRGESVKAYLAQDFIPGIGDGPEPMQARLLEYLDENRARPAQMLATLRRYASAVDGAGDPKQASLFGESRPTREELWDIASKAVGSGTVGSAALALGTKALEPKVALKVYRQLKSIEAERGTLEGPQAAALYRAERSLGQTFLFDVEPTPEAAFRLEQQTTGSGETKAGGAEQLSLFNGTKAADFKRDQSLAESGGWRKLEGADAAGQKNVIRAGGEARLRFLGPVWQMFEDTYRAIGHQYADSAELMAEPTLWDVIMGEDGKPIAFNIAKIGPTGYKATAFGSNGSVDGKQAVRGIIARFGEQGYWAELSDAPAHIATKLGLPRIPAAEAGALLGKEVTPQADGYTYERWITGLPEPHIKSIFGLPWKSQSQTPNSALKSPNFAPAGTPQPMPPSAKNLGTPSAASDSPGSSAKPPTRASDSAVPLASATKAPFYSKLERTIADKMPNRADVATIKGIISNPQTGIKAEELKWSGIVPWVEGKAGGTVGQSDSGSVMISKADVLDYLRTDGAVRFEEVQGTDAPREIKWNADGRIDSGKPSDFNPKFGQYQLPGGENYKETVLAMPVPTSKLAKLPSWAVLKKREGSNAWDVRYGEGAPMAPGSIIASGPSAEMATEFALNELDTQIDLSQPVYTSSHFPDVPNYVAHMRTNERTDAEGKAGLFIEEIQSDRHQAGREKGYREDSPPQVARVVYEVFQPDSAQFPMAWQQRTAQGEMIGARFMAANEAEAKAFAESEADSRQTNEQALNVATGSIPDAPFRTTWPLQMFKRALVDAVASGKKWIGWTTGETQAERYDLSKQVDSIRTEHIEEAAGVHFVDVKMNSGQTINMEVEDGNVREGDQGTTGKPLSDVIGKEMAERILAVPRGGSKTFSGDGLKVGGEGMKGFYDSILPKEISKYVKQWGAGVRKGGISDNILSQNQVESVDWKSGIGEWEVRFADDTIINVIGSDAATEAEAKEQALEIKGRRDKRAGLDSWRNKTTPIWRVDITPAMKDGVESGQALFAGTKASRREALSGAETTVQGQPVKTGVPVTFQFLHNQESATGIYGKPKKDSDFDRGFEPSGRFVTETTSPWLADEKPEQYIKGELTFQNPIVLAGGEYGSPSSWKRRLSAAFGGKRGKSLSKAIIADGYDGVITAGKYGPGEILDLTTFDEAKALYAGTKKNTEQPRNLAAVHNLSIDNLRHVLKMGGLAVPSLAVIRSDRSTFDNFGEITLVAPPSLVDPQENRQSKVFNADVYSPRYPQVTTILKPGDGRKLSDFFDKWREETLPAIPSGAYSWSSSKIADDIKTEGFGRLKDNPLVTYGFLRSKGEIEPPAAGIEDYKYRDELRKLVSGREPELEMWLRNRLSDLKIYPEEKIFNGFTYSGNKRYLPHNLDTVVKLLKKELKDGEGYNYGVPSIRAAYAKPFRSLKAIQENRDHIIPEKEMEALKEEVNQEFETLANEILPMRSSGREGFGAQDAFSDDMKAMVQGGGENMRHLREMYPGADAYESVFKPMRAFLDKLRHMPTEYFESKVQRVVHLTEFSGAVVPDDTPKDLIDALEQRKGLEVVSYPRNDKPARAKAVQDMAERTGALFAGTKARIDAAALEKLLARAPVIESRDGMTLGAPEPVRISGSTLGDESSRTDGMAPEGGAAQNANEPSPGGLSEAEVIEYHRSEMNGSSYLHLTDPAKRWFRVRVADHANRTSNPDNKIDLFRDSRNSRHGITQLDPQDVSILVDEPLSEEQTQSLARAVIDSMDAKQRDAAIEDGAEIEIDARVKYYSDRLRWANTMAERNGGKPPNNEVRSILEKEPAKLAAAQAWIQKSQSTPQGERDISDRGLSKTGETIPPQPPPSVNPNLNPTGAEGRVSMRLFAPAPVRPAAQHLTNIVQQGAGSIARYDSVQAFADWAHERRRVGLAKGTVRGDSTASYDTAPTDTYTGAHSLITGSRVTGEQGQAIGARHAERLRRGLRSGGEGGANGGALAASRGRAFVVPVLTAAQFDKLTSLDEIGEGSEATVYADKAAGVVYKVLSGHQGSPTLGIWPEVYYTADGKLDYRFMPATKPRQLGARIAVQTLLGGTPTEFAGIGPRGQVILKQPLSPDADLMGIAQADEESMALGGPEMAQRVATAISTHDAGLVQIPKGMLLDQEAVRPYVVVVEGRPWMVTDVRTENFVGDNQGEARINDPVVANIPGEMIARVPGLAAVVTEAGQQAARLGDRSARLFAATKAMPEELRTQLDSGTVAERHVWRKNAEGGQTIGNRQAIVRADEQLFKDWIKPRIRRGFAKNLTEYEAKVGMEAHLSFVDAGRGWELSAIGPVWTLRPGGRAAKWAMGVKTFDDPEGEQFRQVADSSPLARLSASSKSPSLPVSPSSPSPLARLGWNHADKALSSKVAAHTRWLRESAGETVARWQGKPNAAPFMALGKLLKRELFPDSILPREIAAKKREMEIKTSIGAQKGMDLVRALTGTPKFSDMAYPEEFSKNPMHRRNLYLAMTGESPMSALHPAIQQLGAKLRKMLVEMGREAVKQGRMSTDTFAALEQGYMPHYYKEDVQKEKSLFHRFRLGVRDILAQRTTAWHIVDMANKDPRTGEPRLVSWQGNQWRFRNQEHRDAFFEDFLLQQALDEITNRNGKKNRSLTLADLRAPAALDAETRGRLAEIKRNLQMRYKKEKPLSVDEQEKAGLIMDPVYAIARYTAQMVHDNSTAEFFNFVAGNKEWVSDNASPGFAEIPDNPRFGRLASKYVTDDVAAQILEMVEAPNQALQIYDTILGWWKTGKTIYNIGTHVRNVLSNLFFAQLAGSSLHNPGNIRYYKSAITSLRNGGSELMEAYEMGVLGADFVSAELRQTLRQLLPDPSTINETDGKAEGILMGIGKSIGRIVPQWAANPLHKFHNSVTALYQVEDEVFKLAAYLKARGMGMSKEEARDHVRQWFPFFDQGSSGSLKTLGRTAMPFLGFYRQSIRIFGEAVKHRPIALAGGMAIPSLITLLSAFILGLEDDDMEEIKKDMRGKAGKLLGPTPLGGLPLFSMLLPKRSSTGEVQQFDLSGIYPFTDILGTRVEGVEGQGWWQQMWRAFISGGPLQSLAYANALNIDSFSNKEIIEPGMGTGEALQKRFENAYQTLMPPLAPGIPLLAPAGGQNIETLSKAGALPWQEAQRGADKTLRERSPTQAVARAVFGIDVRPGSPDIYRQADDWRKAKGYEVIEGMDYGSTTPASRARKALFATLAQDNPNLNAVKNITKRLKEMGHPVETPKDIQQLLFFKDPAHLIGGNKKLGIEADDARRQFRASLNGESRRLYDDAISTFQRIKARAPALIMQAQMAP